MIDERVTVELQVTSYELVTEQFDSSTVRQFDKLTASQLTDHVSKQPVNTIDWLIEVSKARVAGNLCN
jgi:hypothetical protein